MPASPFLNTREDPPKGLSFLSSLHSSQKVAPEQPTHSAVHIDFCVGCLHVSLASNDISIAAFIGSDVRGNLLLDTPGQPRLFAEFSDINVRKYTLCFVSKLTMQMKWFANFEVMCLLGCSYDLEFIVFMEIIATVLWNIEGTQCFVMVYCVDN